MQSEERAMVALADELMRLAYGDRTDRIARARLVHQHVADDGGDVMEQVTALLRDVVRETSVTIEALRFRGIPEASLEMLET